MESSEVDMIRNSEEEGSNSRQRPSNLDESTTAIKSNDVTSLKTNTEHTDPLPNSITSSTDVCSLASKQLAAGFLQIIETPVAKVRSQLKELISKQNKIYVDLSAEKFKLDNAEIVQLHYMMNNIKIYREKLLKIKKQMQSIYQRTKSLKKRAQNIEACKQKELQRKLQKQQQEEALIGK